MFFKTCPESPDFHLALYLITIFSVFPLISRVSYLTLYRMSALRVGLGAYIDYGGKKFAIWLVATLPCFQDPAVGCQGTGRSALQGQGARAGGNVARYPQEST